MSKQIEKLRQSLMRSESERLILRRQCMESENKMKMIETEQNNANEQMQQNEKKQSEQMQTMQKDFAEAMSENERLRKKMSKQKHSICAKMGKAKVLSDDVMILRKQLAAERNLSKMYVDELQS